MRKINMTLAALACVFCVNAGAEEVAKANTAQTQMDCSDMSPEVKQFANSLNMMNKKMFCGQFTADQRSAAMDYAAQQDANGKMMMTPDQAVQKVASENNMMPSQKSPTGCPVK